MKNFKYLFSLALLFLSSSAIACMCMEELQPADIEIFFPSFEPEFELTQYLDLIIIIIWYIVWQGFMLLIRKVKKSPNNVLISTLAFVPFVCAGITSYYIKIALHHWCICVIPTFKFIPNYKELVIFLASIYILEFFIYKIATRSK